MIDATYRRISARLLPFLLLLYIVAYLDRTNVGVAKLQMQPALGLSDSVIGLGAGIFFIGYFLLEIPGALLVERWSARKWLARIMISWGLVASLMGFIGLPCFSAVSVSTQFYTLRFLLGLAEAGFFPALLVYLSHWYPQERRAGAKSLFMIGLPLASIIGVPVTRWIMQSLNWNGWEGWRWVYILEGLPAVVLGFVTLCVLPDRPRHARWLSETERGTIEALLAAERAAQPSGRPFWPEIGAALRHPRVIQLALVYFCVMTSLYGITFFLPSINAALKGSSALTQTLLTMLPYLLALPAMWLNARSSDRRRERRWHLLWPLIALFLGLSGAIFFSHLLVPSLVCFCLAGIGVHAIIPVFWVWPARFLSAAGAAAAMGMINAIGNLGGFAGPYIVGWVKEVSGNFAGGMSFLAATAGVGLILAWFLPRQPAGPTAAARPAES
jgi:MFS family permease